MELIARYGGLPEALAPFCEAAPMQRLRQIGMHCGCEYTACPIYEGKAPYTRYLHSLGAAAIVWHFTKDAAQSLSALFHDIATPAFAHVVDFLNEDHLRQESTEAPTHEILAGNMQIQALLRPLGLCTHDVDDYHRYPIADNDSPRPTGWSIRSEMLTGYSARRLAKFLPSMAISSPQRRKTVFASFRFAIWRRRRRSPAGRCGSRSGS